MKIASFLKLVEIQTKVASLFPFALGTVYAIYEYHRFIFMNFLYMFISLLTFDMATTAINNYIDYKRANKTHGYNYEKHNAIVRDNLRESTVIAVITVLLMVSSASGFVLFMRTNMVVLIVGVLSFMVGILYSFGPIPISRMPLGEIFSGFFMGFVIVFLSTFVHIYDQNMVSLLYQKGIVNISLNLTALFRIFMISLPAAMGIANIMLANNICDIEDDIVNKRYTLPIYIGKEKSLVLFKALYYIAYINILLLLIAGVLPLTSILVLPTFILVSKNIREFFKKQTKKDTFVLSVKNFLIITLAEILTILAGISICSLL